MIRAALLLSILLAVVCSSAEARTRARCHAEGISNAYDDVFRTMARRHMSEPLRSRWCLLKAICQVESR